MQRNQWLVMRFLGLLGLGGLGLAGLVLWGQGCQSQSGLYCQHQSDCQDGLICSRPAGAPTGQDSYGVCEPARHGQGEICLRSADCQSGLRCSNEHGVFNDDERHGLCETYDAGQPADLQAVDLRMDPPPDMTAVDMAVVDLIGAG